VSDTRLDNFKNRNDSLQVKQLIEQYDRFEAYRVSARRRRAGCAAAATQWYSTENAVAKASRGDRREFAPVRISSSAKWAFG
jgi:hypothetical protein